MIWIVFALLACVASAFVAGAETAFFKLSLVERDELRRLGDPRSLRVVSLLEKPRRLLLTLLVVNEAANLLFAASIALCLLDLFGPDLLFLNLLIAMPLILLLCEAIPKGLAVRSPVAYARTASPVVFTLFVVLAPVRWALMVTAEKLLLPLGISPWSLPRQMQEHEIRHLVDEGEKEGTINKDEHKLIHNVFAFGDTVVERLMTPRTEMVAFDVATPIEKLLEGIRNQRFARVPIYRGNPDNIMGILYTKDLLTLRLVDRIGPRRAVRRNLMELLRKPNFVPITKKADELFLDLQTQGVHMGIVVDEYGGVAGLITMSDLLGELFGEMLDEYDQEEPLALREMPDGSFEVVGAVELATFNEVAHAHLPEDEDFSTLGGYVLDRLGHLPVVGEQTQADGWAFEVLAVEGSRVVKVKATRLPDLDDSGTQEVT